MSRLGKRPIQIADNIEVTIESGIVKVKGPKGELEMPFDTRIQIEKKESDIVLTNHHNDKDSKAKHGLYWALIRNMLEGVTNGYQKELELVGVGYRVQLKGKSLEFALGFSHPLMVEPPTGVEFKVEGTNKVIVSGIDKQAVGQIAANIRELRPPDPYKAKGVRYSGEYIRRKQGKTVKK